MRYVAAVMSLVFPDSRIVGLRKLDRYAAA